MLYFAADALWQDSSRSITIQNHTFDREIQSRQLTTSVLKTFMAKILSSMLCGAELRKSIMYVGVWRKLSIFPSLEKKKNYPSRRHSFIGRVIPLLSKNISYVYQVA